MCSKIENEEKFLKVLLSELSFCRNRRSDENGKMIEKYKWRRIKKKRLINQLIYFSN